MSRTAIALMLAPAMGIPAGILLPHAGFGALPTLLVLSIVCPAILCRIATSHQLGIAMLVNAVMVAAAVVAINNWNEPDIVVIVLVVLGISLGIAAMVGWWFRNNTKLE